MKVSKVSSAGWACSMKVYCYHCAAGSSAVFLALDSGRIPHYLVAADSGDGCFRKMGLIPFRRSGLTESFLPHAVIPDGQRRMGFHSDAQQAYRYDVRRGPDRRRWTHFRGQPIHAAHGGSRNRVRNGQIPDVSPVGWPTTPEEQESPG